MKNDVLRSGSECEAPDLTPSHEPIVGQISFHHLIIYVGTISAGLAILTSFFHILHHAFNCYRVSEQKYLMRVILVVPAFAIIHTLGVWWYPSFHYIATIPEIAEAVALVSLFQLFVQQAAGSTHRYEQDQYFANLERHKAKQFHQMFSNDVPAVVLHDKGSLRWYRAICCCIYQFPVVKLVWTPIYIILYAVFCPTSGSGRVVKILNGIVNGITTTYALYGLIIFYSRLRPILKPNHAFRKAFVLKKVIGIVLLQASIFSFLEGGKAIHPTAQMSFGDYTVGVPGIMAQAEFLIFAIGFLFCYPVSEYKNISGGDQEGDVALRPRKVNFAHALWSMINISDLVIAIARSGKHLFELRRKVYTLDESRMPAKQGSLSSSQASLMPPSNVYNPTAAPNQYPQDHHAPSHYASNQYPQNQYSQEYHQQSQYPQGQYQQPGYPTRPSMF